MLERYNSFFEDISDINIILNKLKSWDYKKYDITVSSYEAKGSGTAYTLYYLIRCQIKVESGNIIIYGMDKAFIDNLKNKTQEGRMSSIDSWLNDNYQLYKTKGLVVKQIIDTDFITDAYIEKINSLYHVSTNVEGKIFKYKFTRFQPDTIRDRGNKKDIDFITKYTSTGR